MTYFIIQFSKFSWGWPPNPPPTKKGEHPLGLSPRTGRSILGFAPNMDPSIFRVDPDTFFLKQNPDKQFKLKVKFYVDKFLKIANKIWNFEGQIDTEVQDPQFLKPLVDQIQFNFEVNIQYHMVQKLSYSKGNTFEIS